jgi:hypothetical protein
MRISQKDLRLQVDRLNDITGMPDCAYVLNDKTGKFEPQAGAYILSGAYGGWKLERMSLDEGCTGVTTPVAMGYCSKRECYDIIRAYIAGIVSMGAKDAPPFTQ